MEEFRLVKNTPMRQIDNLSVEYTKSQYEGLLALLDWSDGTSSYTYTLEGAAGTGKSTIIKDFIKFSKFNRGIAVSATTHKAKNVISNMTGMPGVTIQKLLGLRPNVEISNFDVTRPQFDPRGIKYIKDFQLVIIDEASMINTGLYRLIENEARTNNVKVLYVGDAYQLPPVKENISPVFTTSNRYILTEIVRQEKDNPLLHLLTNLRSDIRTGKMTFRTLIDSKPNASHNGVGYYTLRVNNKLQYEKFGQFLIQAFSKPEFNNNIDYCRYTAYTNDNILQYNKYIRDAIINDEKILVEGDVLTAYTTIVRDFDTPIVNSEDYKIIDIGDIQNNYGLRGFLIKMKSLTNHTDTPPVFVVDHNNAVSMSRFFEIFNKLLYNAETSKGVYRAKAFEKYYEFKNSSLLLKSYYKDNRLLVGKDLDYAYCLTTHKTQGSTYENIFVNVNNILAGMSFSKRDAIFRNQLLYVALSRASKNAVILI